MGKKQNIIIWWVFWILYLEIVYKIFIVKDFLSVNTLYVILFSMVPIIINSIVTSFFSNKANKIITIVLSSLFMLVYLAQIVYFNFYDSIISFYSLTTGTGQVMHFIGAIFDVMLRVWYIFIIVLIPYVLFLIFNSKIFSFKRNSKVMYLYEICILIISFIGITFSICLSSDNIYSLKRLLFKTHAPMITIKQTGLYTMQAIDMYRYFFGFEDKLLSSSNNDIEVNKSNYNIYNIDYSQIKSDNYSINELSNYFASITPTEKNEYTGILKNKNIIFITAESFDTIAIDEKLTPTLYKMANNSFVFNNYYQPLYPVSTSDGEYMNINSLIPEEGVWSFYKSSKINMPLGFGNMFTKNGYNAFGFHNYNYNFYNRELSYPNIGLKYYACGTGLEKNMDCNNWPNSDKEMIDASINYYIDSSNPFAVYYMTVSGHLNYDFSTNDMAIKNREYVSDLNYSESVKAYLATQIELDKAMEELINYLEENNKLNDTLIVLAPDHYPYGLTKNEINEISNIDRSDKFENYHTTLIMYNPLIEKTVIDKVVSSIDILPTIYNLCGIDFDSRLLAGTDIFSEKEGIVILSDRSWITDKGKYNSISGKFTKNTEEDVTKEYISKINDIVNNKFSMSSLILDTNYYSIIGIK